MAAGEALLVVDGYNLARSLWSGIDPEEERRRTVALLEDVAARSRGGVVVVFDGDSTLWTLGKDEPTTLEHRGSTWGRGTGVVEMARAIAEGQPERASGAVASHALDVMLGIRDAAESGQAVEITSRIAKPEPLPEDFDPAAAVLAEGVNA